MEPIDKNITRIAVTMGDAAGIGPEIVVKALARGEISSRFSLLVLGQERAIEQVKKISGLDVEFSLLQRHSDWDPYDPRPALLELGRDLEGRIPRGRVSAEAGKLAVRCIEKAARLAMANVVDAVVTCPIHKEAITRAGLKFPGHTEFLAHLTGADKVVMMLAGKRLRVTLATIHCPLSQVSKILSPGLVFETIMVTHQGLRRDFGMSAPRLAVAGLNPHAGEGGLFGREELEIIAPAVEDARKEGIDVSGPWPPDTVFFRAVENQFDAVVCMYHDQGLIPLKLLHFHDGVNVTLGLPIIRVSVDHGTAFDIAGQGLADPTSLINALQTAGEMAGHRAASRTGKSE